ncbi:MAG: DUF2267 domain-containing protein [Rubrobacter sp.]
MESSELVENIRRRARLRSAEEARRLLEGTLQALAHVLPEEHIDALFDCMPEGLIWCLRCGPPEPDPLIDDELFLGWVMSSIETTGARDDTLGGDDPLAALIGDEARERVRVVLEELWPRLGDRSAEVSACLPEGLAGSTERFRLR